MQNIVKCIQSGGRISAMESETSEEKLNRRRSLSLIPKNAITAIAVRTFLALGCALMNVRSLSGVSCLRS